MRRSVCSIPTTRRRIPAADENILAFDARDGHLITPKSGVSRLFRDAVLDPQRATIRSRASSSNSGRLFGPGGGCGDSPSQHADPEGAFVSQEVVAPVPQPSMRPSRPAGEWLLDYSRRALSSSWYSAACRARWSTRSPARGASRATSVTIDGASSATGSPCATTRASPRAPLRWTPRHLLPRAAGPARLRALGARVDVCAVMAALARATCND
jgi:hypothetical protein